MATEAATPTFARGIGQQKPLLKKGPKSNEPTLDEEGNIILAKQDPESKYCQPSPIPRLASAAALKPKDKIPTAGGYAISLSKEPTVNFPPACTMYEDRPWVLGKLNKAALGVPEPADPVPIDMERLEKILAGLDVDVPKAVAPGKKVVKDDHKAKVSEGGDKPIEDKVAETIAKVFTNTKKRSKSRNSSKSPNARKSTPSSPRIQPSNNLSRTPTPKSPRGGDAPAAVAAASEKLAPSPRAPKKVVDAK